MKQPLLICFFLVVSNVYSWSCDDAGSDTNVTLSINWLEDDTAVCNDGSQAAYYIKKSATGSSDWLVYLAGGGMCYDEVSCAERWNGTGYPEHDCESSDSSSPCFMSSKDYADTCGKTGIFDADPAKSSMFDANKIYLPYCSSDFHIGDIGDSYIEGFQFRGASIVRAMLRDLSVSHGLGESPHDLLIFGGGSAGGRGAMAWLDAVEEYVPESVSVAGFLDSNYYQDLAPYPLSEFGGFQTETKIITMEMNGTALLSIASPTCAAGFDPDDVWRCHYGVHRMPFIELPYLMTHAQYDGWQLSHDVHDYEGIESDPVYTDDEMLYVNRFGAMSSAWLRTLPSEMNSPQSSIYSTGCYNHHISEKSGFYSTTTSTNVTEAMALGVFIDQVRAGKVGQSWFDDCVGYECGLGC